MFHSDSYFGLVRCKLGDLLSTVPATLHQPSTEESPSSVTTTTKLMLNFLFVTLIEAGWNVILEKPVDQQSEGVLYTNEILLLYTAYHPKTHCFFENSMDFNYPANFRRQLVKNLISNL